MQTELLIMASAGAVVAAAASYAERRRMRRVDIDRVGMLPLTAITFAGILVAVLGLAFGLKP